MGYSRRLDLKIGFVLDEQCILRGDARKRLAQVIFFNSAVGATVQNDSVFSRRIDQNNGMSGRSETCPCNRTHVNAAIAQALEHPLITLRSNRPDMDDMCPRTCRRDRLVRAFAAEQGANPLTVAKAYQQFQLDGLVDVQRGVGMFVAPGALELLRQRRRESLGRRFLEPLAAEARSLGISRDQLQRMLDDAWAASTPTGENP